MWGEAERTVCMVGWETIVLSAAHGGLYTTGEGNEIGIFFDKNERRGTKTMYKNPLWREGIRYETMPTSLISSPEEKEKHTKELNPCFPPSEQEAINNPKNLKNKKI